MDAITLTRGAAIAGSSAPALMPTGKPRDRPAPHRIAPTNATGVTPPKTNSTTPAALMADITRSTTTRP